MAFYPLDSDSQDEPISLKDLQADGRYDVKFAYSMHACKEVPEGVRMHLVLKFKYHESIIEPVLLGKKPTTNYEKQYGTPHRIFPYCVFNSLQEERISWTYQSDNGQVLERIEVMITVMKLSLKRYFPQVVSVICLKVGSDGTGNTGKVNFFPEGGGGRHNVDLSCFTKDTSEFCLKEDDPDSFSMCTYVRDLRQEAVGNIPNIYTRVYATMIFKDDHFQNSFRYTILSLVMLNSTILIGIETSPGTCSQTGLAIAFLTVGLLFSLPSDELTTAAIIVIAHAMYEMILTCCLTAEVWINEWSMRCFWLTLGCNSLATLLTLIYRWSELMKFNQLKYSIAQSVHCGEGMVGSFAKVDKLM